VQYHQEYDSKSDYSSKPAPKRLAERSNSDISAISNLQQNFKNYPVTPKLNAGKLRNPQMNQQFETTTDYSGLPAPKREVERSVSAISQLSYMNQGNAPVTPVP